MTKKTALEETAGVSKTELRTELLLNRLLDAATAFFMEKGFDATSMGEIAKQAHASTETFYRHFPTKEELFQRVLLRRTSLLSGEPLDLSRLCAPSRPTRYSSTATF